MIEGVTNADAVPVLERMIQFAGQRHRLIVNNIANLSTPGFRPQDVSVEGFQQQLGEAIDARRAASGASGGDLPLQDSQEVTVRRDGMVLHPRPVGDNILFHDGNDRNVERLMQDLAENFLAFRTTAELLRSRFDLINTAIREHL
ncbi:MAG: flagellar basal body rod protein FlgB [Planctomycetota bacterium]|jgi:flagellar basal-body rod protein FlgB